MATEVAKRWSFILTKGHEELLRVVLQLTTEEGGTIDLYDGEPINAVRDLYSTTTYNQELTV